MTATSTALHETPERVLAGGDCPVDRPQPADTAHDVDVRVAVRRLVRGCLWGERDRRGLGKVVSCGLPVPDVGRVAVGRGGILGGQLIVCGSPLRCGWCSPLQWLGSRARLVWSVGRWVDSGGWVGLSRLSLRHGLADDLGPLLGQVRGGLSGVSRSKGVRLARGRAGVRCSWSVLHVKFGGNGWGPHVHLVHFGEGDSAALEEFGGRLGGAWCEGVKASGGRVWGPVASDTRLLSRPGVLGLWEADDSWHPGRCGHPDHKGCADCEPASMPGSSSSDGGDWSDGGWPGDGKGEGGSLPVWGGLDRLAVAGDRRAQAKVLEFVRVTEGQRRVPSNWRWLGELVGKPPEEVGVPVRPEREAVLYVDAALAARVEWLDRSVGSWVSGGARGDVGVLARSLEVRAGESVSVGRAEDGLPMLSLKESA